MAARAGKKDIAQNAKIHTHVFLGHPKDPDMEGFGLRVELTVEGCDDDAIIASAHDVSPPPASAEELTPTSLAQFCAYSRALKHGVEVTVNKA